MLIALALAAAVLLALATPISGFMFATKPAEQQELLAAMMRLFVVSSPFLLGLGGIAMGVLNARERFGWTAAAFNLYNLAIIAGALLLAPRYGIWGVADGVVIGALLYLLIMLPGLRQERWRYTARLGLRDAAVRRVGRLLVPRLVGQGAAQIGLITTAFFAGRLPNNQFSSLNLANQLMLLPHGVFVISLATVMYPQLARLWAARDRAGFSATAFQTLRLVIFVTAPLAVLMATLRVPIVRLLYERGAFTGESTGLVAVPLLWFATSIVGFAAAEPLVRTFYAMQDTRTPVYVAVLTIGLNVLVSYLVVNYTDWGTGGLAFAFSLANNLEALALFILLRRRLPMSEGAGLRRSLLGVLVSSVVLGAALRTLLNVSARWLPMVQLGGSYGQGADALWLAGWLGGAGLLSLALYVGVAALLRVPEVSQARAALLRRR